MDKDIGEKGRKGRENQSERAGDLRTEAAPWKKKTDVAGKSSADSRARSV